jgi:superfamily I DNA/RNA helicase
LEQTGIFDYLIVDEAQNLCDEVFLKLMDALLKGGLSNGRWTMFGDFTNQNIVSSHPNGTDPLTDFGLNWSNDMLETNCRNTYEISVEVARLVDIESPPMSGVRGPEVQIEYFTSLEELESLLDNLAVNFKNKYFSSRQIILLSSGHGEEFNTKRDYGGWKLLNIRDEKLPSLKSREDVLVYDDTSSDNTLRYSNVYDFQGLESDLVILVLPVTKDQVVLAGDITLPREKHLNRVLYTGMSRAKTMLIVVAHESYKETLELRVNLYDKLKVL